MEQLLTKMIDERGGDKGQLAVNLGFKHGQVQAGMLSKGEGEGMFVLGTAMPVGGGQEGETIMVEVFFEASQVATLLLPMPQSTIVVPEKKIIM